jgi:hypothetical protein
MFKMNAVIEPGIAPYSEYLEQELRSDHAGETGAHKCRLTRQTALHSLLHSPDLSV